MEENKDPKKFENQVIQRLANLEEHIINLIVPIQQINSLFREPQQVKNLINALSKPIVIDDRSLKMALADLSRMLEVFDLQLEKCNLSEFTNEIKYIGNRLKEIQQHLYEMDDRIKLRAVKIFVDGKEMIPGADTVHRERKIPKRRRRR